METKSIAIDEEGFFVSPDGLRIQDEQVGQKMLDAIRIDEYGVLSMNYDGHNVTVLPFDKPYVAKQVLLEGNNLIIQMPYQYKAKVNLKSLCLDPWDRFHGITTQDTPFVLSRTAQAELFNLATDFSDNSITLLDQEIQTPDYYIDNADVQTSEFWSNKYKTEPKPRWDLDKPHPELKSFLQQLRINKCRILVAGCGYGHDAAYLAEQGHIVTAIDISDEALQGAKKRYGHLKNLSFANANVFKLDESHHQAYDIVFEHTCFCAIDPNERKNLVSSWHRYLTERGHLLGIFFVVPKRNGPYFGGSEWELRELLEKKFQFLYWTRLQFSPGWRHGAELMIYAQKRGS